MTSQLQLLSLDGQAARLIGPERGVVTTWAWSRDGRCLVLTADEEAAWQTDFFLYDLAAGALRRLTTDLPCLPAGGQPLSDPPSHPFWLDDQRVLFHAIEGGRSGLYELDTRSGALTVVQRWEALHLGCSADASGRVVAQSYSSLEGTGEVVVYDREAGRTTVVTQHNREVWAAAPPAAWETFQVRRDGFVIDAWLLKPPDFDPAKLYPLILDVHGGPNGFYGFGFNAVQQCLASNGFLVVFANPRGSSSYGRTFTKQVLGDWGGEDYADLMAVVDAALARPYADPDRTGIWGYSYGGYMTAWTIGRNHRFRAAVCGAPCFDLESMYGTSDISHFFGEIQWGGPPHSEREWYTTRSPSTSAHNTRTPTLIVHGEADERCPIGQGEQMFVALKKAGCEVEFARYPGASHMLLRSGTPAQREDVLSRILSWFQSHLGGVP